MGDYPKTCCTWKVDTDGGTRQPTITEFSYDATAGYGASEYKCTTCRSNQLTELVKKKVASAGWAGNLII